MPITSENKHRISQPGGENVKDKSFPVIYQYKSIVRIRIKEGLIEEIYQRHWIN